ncbi:hypothetical protein F5Y16DRAFT_386450 [Xylariaceae sp. FL0255]|nr:hypothetical protein F5Y16DRAFT_386450 [Xylariaceae sp. FL0255]
MPFPVKRQKRQKRTHTQTFDEATFADKKVSFTDAYNDEPWKFEFQELRYEAVTELGLSTAVSSNELEPVCFGAICFSLDCVERSTIVNSPVAIEVSERRILSAESGSQVGTLTSRDTDLIALFNSEGVCIEALLIPALDDQSSQSPSVPQVMLTLYRTQKLEEEWVNFFEEQIIYLQDPVYTQLDFPYWNP